MTGTVTMKTVCYGKISDIVLLMAGLTVGVIATISEFMFTRWLIPSWGDRLRTTPTTSGAVMFELTFRTMWVSRTIGKARLMTTTVELAMVRIIVVTNRDPSWKWWPRNDDSGTAVVIISRHMAATYRMAVAPMLNLATSLGNSMATIALARTLTNVSEFMVMTVLTRCPGTCLREAEATRRNLPRLMLAALGSFP